MVQIYLCLWPIDYGDRKTRMQWRLKKIKNVSFHPHKSPNLTPPSDSALSTKWKTRFGWWFFSWDVCFFRGWNLKSRVSSHKFSKQLVGPIDSKFFWPKDQLKISTSIENRNVMTSSWLEMTSSKKSSFFPRTLINLII